MTLLFVEDEYYTRNGILASMDWAAHGIDAVETAADGKRGLEFLHTRPDILLTDIRMPYASGLEIAERYKENDPACEVIILSSYSDKEYLFKAISLASVAYIEKPVDMEELSAALRQAVSRRKQSLLLRELAQSASAAQYLPDPDAPGYSHSTRMALRHIAEHYADPMLSVSGIAQAVHLSAVYLSTSFKEDTGLGLKRLLTDMRISMARDLLLRTNLSIADIAERVGCSNANYFSKLFRRETGCTPNEYRAAEGKHA